MYDPRNPTRDPEIGPINSVGPVSRGPVVFSGSIKFSKQPLTEDPMAIIKEGTKQPLAVFQQKASEAINEKK